MRKRLFFGILGSLLFLSSCDKENVVSIGVLNEVILGSWSKTDVIPSGRSEVDFRYFDMVTTYRFDLNQEYSYTVDFYGFKDENPEEIMGYSKNTGTYEVIGDSIFFKAMVYTSWEQGFQPNPETIQLSGETYGNRFKIKDEILTLFYISYPADAPVPTQMSYEKVNP